MTKKRIVILEGPDGGGKTTLGVALAAHFGVDVHNHGPYKDEAQIWKHYFDSMLPAYAGERDVILDRSWLAEPVYGKVYRNGFDRMELWQLRILEHVAMECNTTLVYCLPGVEACVKAFNSRREKEMLKNDQQLRDVYSLYVMQLTGDMPHYVPFTFASYTTLYNYNYFDAKDLINAL